MSRLTPSRSVSDPQTDMGDSYAQSTASSFTLVQTTMPLSSLPPTDASPDADKDAIHLLIHATNSFGTWSAGFALALRKLFPAADLVYKSYCNDVRPSPDEWPTRD